MKHYDWLVVAIEEPLVLAAKLKAKGYIGRSLMCDIQLAKEVSDDDKSIQLLNAVEALWEFMVMLTVSWKHPCPS